MVIVFKINYHVYYMSSLVFLKLSNTIYITGINIKVNKVEKKSPPITATAIGLCISEPSPLLNAKGIYFFYFRYIFF